MNIAVIIKTSDIEIALIALELSLKFSEKYRSASVILIGNGVDIEFIENKKHKLFRTIYEISSGYGNVYAYEISKKIRGHNTDKRMSPYDCGENEFYEAVKKIDDNDLFKIIDQANKVVTF